MSKKNTTNQNSRKPRNGLTHRNKLGFIDPTIAGIDIGANLIHVAIPNAENGVNVFEFRTTTPELHKIAEELKKAGVKTAVMEATGVYWIPLYEILEDLGFISVLVDAKAVKNVPGRKSDIHDAQWIQTLYSNGLLRAAFRPPRDRLALRAFVRQRQSIIKTRQRALLQMEKALQLMNIKLSGALSDIGGVSGMDIIRAILKGERDPAKLADIRSKTCKKPKEEFIAALTGNFQKEHIFSLKQAMDLYDFGGQQLNECDQNIRNEIEALPTITDKPLPKRDKDKKANGKYRKAQKPKKNTLSFNVRELLWQKSGIDATSLDGIEENSALLLFAELGGTDVSSWSRDKEFASWLKLCPGNNISGGKRRKSKKQPCANYISQCFRMASLAAKKSDSAVGAKIRCISGRADKPKGIKAGAHHLAILYYNMCKHGWEYHRKGAADYEQAHNKRRLESIKRSASSLGYDLVQKSKAA
jgi:transposase